MNYGNIQNMADKLHRNAKNGNTTINGNLYDFAFDHYAGVYEVTENGETLIRLNTRKITVAKTWLKEYLAN